MYWSQEEEAIIYTCLLENHHYCTKQSGRSSIGRGNLRQLLFNPILSYRLSICKAPCI